MDKRMQLRNEALAVIAALAERWPLCFSDEPKPLALGISNDILAAGFPSEGLERGLRWYAQGFSYLRAMRAGAARINLDGAAAGVVSAEHAAQAAERLADWTQRKRQRAAQPVALEPAPVPTKPKRLSLGDLRASAAARKTCAA
jgi:ProP effector